MTRTTPPHICVFDDIDSHKVLYDNFLSWSTTPCTPKIFSSHDINTHRALCQLYLVSFILVISLSLSLSLSLSNLSFFWSLVIHQQFQIKIIAGLANTLYILMIICIQLHLLLSFCYRYTSLWLIKFSFSANLSLTTKQIMIPRDK